MASDGVQSGKFRTICVFCGSNPGFRKVFSDAALELGHEMVCVLLNPFSFLGFKELGFVEDIILSDLKNGSLYCR